jgi:hypothetical protein
MDLPNASSPLSGLMYGSLCKSCFTVNFRPIHLSILVFRMNSFHMMADMLDGIIVDLLYTMLLIWALQGRCRFLMALWHCKPHIFLSPETTSLRTFCVTVLQLGPQCSGQPTQTLSTSSSSSSSCDSNIGSSSTNQSTFQAVALDTPDWQTAWVLAACQTA